jgi:RNA polymerase sigma factor (sigma-70 family)
MRTCSDLELLRLWNNGDPSAAGELFRRHIATLRRFFRRRLNEDAEDLVQETFLACLENAQSFREEASVATFLGSIARHKLSAEYRIRSRNRMVTDMLVDCLDRETRACPPCPLERKSLEEAVSLLPEPLRRVLVLTYWNGLPQETVARKLGIPAGTVASRVRRAKTALHRVLSEKLDAATAADTNAGG